MTSPTSRSIAGSNAGIPPIALYSVMEIQKPAVLLCPREDTLPVNLNIRRN
jgi:hypothetical protein